MKSKLLLVTFSLMMVAFCVQAADLTALVSSGTGVAGKKGKITLTITGGMAPYTVLWSGPAGFSSTELNPDSLAAGLYCVRVQDAYCGVADLCVTVNAQSSNVSSLGKELTLSVAPNPFDRRIEVQLPADQVGRSVVLLLQDQLGRVVARKDCIGDVRIPWDLDVDLPEATYILTLIPEQGARQVQRLLKARL